jgi:hypothetical protein
MPLVLGLMDLIDGRYGHDTQMVELISPDDAVED